MRAHEYTNEVNRAWARMTACHFRVSGWQEGALLVADVQISMDGRGRALDNVFVERLWRTVKYEHVYLHEVETVMQLERGLAGYFGFYNHERPHQSLPARCAIPPALFS